MLMRLLHETALPLRTGRGIMKTLLLSPVVLIYALACLAAMIAVAPFALAAMLLESIFRRPGRPHAYDGPGERESLRWYRRNYVVGRN